MTGGRLKLVKKYVENETFCFTYGDTLNNVKIDELINFHFDKKVLATVTACKPPEKYGLLKIENEKVVDFQEKPHIEGEWVNGGFLRGNLTPNKLYPYMRVLALQVMPC